MNLSKISQAINTLCHQCTPAPAPPGAGAPVWLGMDFAAGPDKAAYLEFVHPDDSRPTFNLRGEARKSFWRVVDRDIWGELTSLVLPPDATSDEDYRKRLYAGEVGYMIETRWIENAGQPPVLRQRAVNPWKPSGNWWKIGGMPPVFQPPSVTQAALEATFGSMFTVRQITEQQAADEINGQPKEDFPTSTILDDLRQAREDFKQHQKDFEQFVIDRYSKPRDPP